MEDLPNKVRDILGILVDVHLNTTNGKDWLSIRTCLKFSNQSMDVADVNHSL